MSLLTEFHKTVLSQYYNNNNTSARLRPYYFKIRPKPSKTIIVSYNISVIKARRADIIVVIALNNSSSSTTSPQLPQSQYQHSSAKSSQQMLSEQENHLRTERHTPHSYQQTSLCWQAEQ